MYMIDNLIDQFKVNIFCCNFSIITVLNGFNSSDHFTWIKYEFTDIIMSSNI